MLNEGTVATRLPFFWIAALCEPTRRTRRDRSAQEAEIRSAPGHTTADRPQQEPTECR